MSPFSRKKCTVVKYSITTLQEPPARNKNPIEEDEKTSSPPRDAFRQHQTRDNSRRNEGHRQVERQHRAINRHRPHERDNPGIA
jgi:hypothetical protein